jgi:hypothetical protein
LSWLGARGKGQTQDEDLEWERKRGTPQYEEWLMKQKKELELGKAHNCRPLSG